MVVRVADVVNLFPLTVYRDRLGLPEPVLAELVHWIREQQGERDRPRAAQQAWLGDTNGFEQLHSDARFEPAASSLRRHIDAYLELLGVCPESFEAQLVRSWATISHGDERILTHAHPHAHLAVVFYPAIHDGAAQIGFTMDRPPNELTPHLFDDAMLDRRHLTERTPFNAKEVFVEVEAGDVVVFPAHVQHFTPARSGDAGERISVACDVVLTLRDAGFVENHLPPVDQWRPL